MFRRNTDFRSRRVNWAYPNFTQHIWRGRITGCVDQSWLGVHQKPRSSPRNPSSHVIVLGAPRDPAANTGDTSSITKSSFGFYSGQRFILSIPVQGKNIGKNCNVYFVRLCETVISTAFVSYINRNFAQFRKTLFIVELIVRDLFMR